VRNGYQFFGLLGKEFVVKCAADRRYNRKRSPASTNPSVVDRRSGSSVLHTENFPTLMPNSLFNFEMSSSESSQKVGNCIKPET
jgi:hypothetical protein